MTRAIHLIVPAPFSAISGGYIYGRRMVEGLSALGQEVRVVELAGRHPFPDETATEAAHAALTAIPGVALRTPAYFNEFTIDLPVEARPVVRALADKGVLGGVSLGRLYPDQPALANGLVVAVTETVTDADITAFATTLKELLA